MCFLLAPVDEHALRGRDVPRPYVLRAPSTEAPGVARPTSYAPGQVLEFGLATFGRALAQFPYALLGIEEMGRRGLGAGRQGQFRVEEVWADNPLAGRQEAIYRRSRDGLVRAPGLPVDAAQVQEEAALLASRGRLNVVRYCATPEKYRTPASAFSFSGCSRSNTISAGAPRPFWKATRQAPVKWPKVTKAGVGACACKAAVGFRNTTKTASSASNSRGTTV